AVELGRRRGVPSESLSQFVEGLEDPGAFADMVAFYLDVAAAEKQELLEVVDVEDRMRRVLLAIERDLLRMEAQQEIEQKVQEELGEKQREMVLREQLKAIQRELGEDDEADEVEELKERIAALELPEEARKEIERELHRLERTHPQSAEYQVIRTYLEWVTELPWNVRTEDRIDLSRAQEVLEEDHYGLEDVKERVLEFLAVRKLQMERAAAEAAAAGAAEGATTAAAEGAAMEPESESQAAHAGAASEAGTEPAAESAAAPESGAEVQAGGESQA